MPIKTPTLFAALVASLLLALAPTRADVTAQDTAAIRGVISAQIEAFRADDAARAYSYAAPSIKQIFPDPSVFMRMVRQGYQPVYRPKQFNFAAPRAGDGDLVQDVEIVGPNNGFWVATYTLERQPDGLWKITGCVLREGPGLAT